MQDERKAEYCITKPGLTSLWWCIRYDLLANNIRYWTIVQWIEHNRLWMSSVRNYSARRTKKKLKWQRAKRGFPFGHWELDIKLQKPCITLSYLRQRHVYVLILKTRIHMEEDLDEVVRERTTVHHRFLCLAHLGSGHESHGIGDLLRVLHCLNPIPEIFHRANQRSSRPSSSSSLSSFLLDRDRRVTEIAPWRHRAPWKIVKGDICSQTASISFPATVLSMSFAKMHVWWHEKHGSAQQRIHWTAGCRSGATNPEFQSTKTFAISHCPTFTKKTRPLLPLWRKKWGSERPGRVGHGSSTKTDPTFYRVECANVWISSSSFVDVFHLKGDMMLPHSQRQLPGILISCLPHDKRLVGSRLWTLQYALSEIT